MNRESFFTLADGLRWAAGLVAIWVCVLGGMADATVVIDSGRYADAAAARAAWMPMAGSGAVEIADRDGRGVLRFPCRFATGGKVERASWDRKVLLDLESCGGVAFDVYCPDSTPMTYFSLYFQSGNGWYHASFFPETSAGWTTVRLEKPSFSKEGSPAGWGRVETIRLSAWRGQFVDTEFYIRDLRRVGVLGEDAPVAIVRTAGDRESEGYASEMAGFLRGMDVSTVILDDRELTGERLKPAAVVVLPYNPGMGRSGVEALASYARAGGRLLVFYIVPDGLGEVLGVRDGRHVREARRGGFSSIRALEEGGLRGAPALVGQRSWNIQSYEPVAGRSGVLAEWLDDKGAATGHTAILGSTNGLVMTHVLLVGDDTVKKRKLVRAMLGYLAPELGERLARESLSRAVAFGRFRSLEEILGSMDKNLAGVGKAASGLEAAAALREKAKASFDARDYNGAIELAVEAREKMRGAWCAAQPTGMATNEFRAFWCHDAFGVTGMDWDEAIRRLAEAGFTAVVPNMLWGGVAYYPSKVLPVAPEVAERGDQIALCLAACRKYGLKAHVWKVDWNLSYRAGKGFVDEMRAAGRLQAGRTGDEEPWLCPSHPLNQQLEIDSMVEVANNYDVDGLHFDYIRYPDSDHCYCGGCRERFSKAIGQTISDAGWPGDVLGEGRYRAQWLQWRRDNITTVVRSVSERVHGKKPGMKISAAVFPNWDNERDSIGQDWKLWCEKGWLDFVCPMDYTGSSRQFANYVTRQLEWAGSVPCYPGIGASASEPPLGVEGVIEQIHTARKLGAPGFIIFNYGEAEARELAPMLGAGITARR